MLWGTSFENLSKIRQETKKLQKMRNDVIVTSFLKITQQFFVCEYFLLIPIDVPAVKLIESQIKELQGGGTNTPRAENDQKSPCRIGLMLFLYCRNHNTLFCFYLLY